MGADTRNEHGLGARCRSLAVGTATGRARVINSHRFEKDGVNKHHNHLSLRAKPPFMSGRSVHVLGH